MHWWVWASRDLVRSIASSPSGMTNLRNWIVDLWNSHFFKKALEDLADLLNVLLKDLVEKENNIQVDKNVVIYYITKDVID